MKLGKLIIKDDYALVPLTQAVILKPLLACPFCGSEAIICKPLEGMTGYVIRCKEWGCCEKSNGTDLDELIRKWNTRLG